MAERGRGAASTNVIRPQLRDGGTKAILGAKVLVKAADMLQNVENMSPQTMARKGRKQVGSKALPRTTMLEIPWEARTRST